MPRSDNQKMKMLYLVKILEENTDSEHGLSMQEIIDTLAQCDIKAERKSIYSDISMLNEYGYDIECWKDGKTYEYRLMSREFELPELKLLVDAVQSSKFITQSKSSKLIKKLEGLTSAYEAGSLHRQVYVANRIKTTNESVFYNVDDIQTAISTNSKISFKYFQWNVKKEKELRHNGATYVVSPWALTWDDENYYMIAYDDETDMLKHFRVDKMLKITVLDEPREGKNRFKSMDMAVYSKKMFGMFGGEEETVVLKCRNEMAGVIIDRFGTDVSMVKMDNEHFKVRVNIMVSPQFFGWLFSLGGGVTIIGPDEVAEQMKKALSDMSNLYKK